MREYGGDIHFIRLEAEIHSAQKQSSLKVVFLRNYAIDTV